MTALFVRIFSWMVGIALIYIGSMAFGALCGLIFQAWWKGYSLATWLIY